MTICVPTCGISSRPSGRASRCCKTQGSVTTRPSAATWPMNPTSGKNRFIGTQLRRVSSRRSRAVLDGNVWLERIPAKGSRSNMNIRQSAVALTTLLTLCVLLFSEQNSFAETIASAQPFLGRWDLTLKTPVRESPSWLEITLEGGQLKARLVSRWGHARPLPKVEVSNGRIMFVSPKEDEERKDDMVFEGKLSGTTLVGMTTGQEGTPWKWRGEKAPDLRRRTEPKWGEPKQLFNGKDLSGWTPSDPNAT